MDTDANGREALIKKMATKEKVRLLGPEQKKVVAALVARLLADAKAGQSQTQRQAGSQCPAEIFSP